MLPFAAMQGEVGVKIGVFDSGIGGLTVLSALTKIAPGHDYLYLGDTARVPYGTRSDLTVVRYSLSVASHLAAQGVTCIVVACNTASTYALPALQAACSPLGIDVIGVIGPGVAAALSAYQGGSIVVLGTEGTIRGHAYQRALMSTRPELHVIGLPCPLFVPLAEEGWVDGDIPAAIALRYLTPILGQSGVVILGCTHYPLLIPVLKEVLPNAMLIDSAKATAQVVAERFGGQNSAGTVEFQVTDHIDRFCRVGTRFLGFAPTNVTWVDLAAPSGSFANALASHTEQVSS